MLDYEVLYYEVLHSALQSETNQGCRLSFLTKTKKATNQKEQGGRKTPRPGMPGFFFSPTLAYLFMY